MLNSLGEVPEEELACEGLPCNPCDSGQYLSAGWGSADSGMHSQLFEAASSDLASGEALLGQTEDDCTFIGFHS